MNSTFSPSINIIRDKNREFNYIPTPNAKRIVSQIQEDFNKGFRSFNLIGSYGTGKSSFLLALEQTISNKDSHFEVPSFKDKNARFVNIVGSSNSIIQSFADYLNIGNKKYKVDDILLGLFDIYNSLTKNNQLLVIVIDELGKFLEYASKNNPEKELYFLQQLAEFANDPNHKIVFITSVHQSFETYSYELSSHVRQEWIKVKGRFKEIAFNEPVDQLLFLASEHISKATKLETTKKEIIENIKLFDSAKAFKAVYSKEIAGKLYPLDLFSANLLTLALQRYGQNERSLFSFLESTDSTGIENFKKSVTFPFYSISNVFDYLVNNFYTFLHSKHNPDSASLSAIRQAIEQVENSFDTDLDDYLRLIKTIGLLNIFSSSGSILDQDFLLKYAKNCIGIERPEDLISNLASKNIIRYRKHSKRYVLSEEAEIDIELALIEASNKVSEISDIPTVLKKYFDFAPVIAKEYSYINGTTRYFHFEISEFPNVLVPINEIDGYIQLIFNEKLTKADFLKIVDNGPSANIYVFYENAKDIKALLFDLEKTRRVLQENLQDKVARRELESIVSHQQSLLNHYILNNLYIGSTDITWFWNNITQNINSKKSFNKLLTKVCAAVYISAPIFKNELVNKHKISSAIHTAKRNYFKGLINNWNQPDLGIPNSKFPPEKMIFRSLLLDNGLSPYKDDVSTPLKEGDSFYELLRVSNEFLESSKSNPVSLVNFVELLSRKPFKLKQGFIDFWIPSFLFLKRDDFALYTDGSFIPTITDDTLELIAKKPKDFQVKAFDVDGVRLDIFNSYRAILNQESKGKLGNDSFIETIKPFLVFYRSLPDYAKSTGRLSKAALAIKESIAKSKDPEFTFFEAFPLALGFTIKDLNENPALLVQYTNTLQDAIKEIRTSFDGLIDRFENFIINDILFDDYQIGFEGLKFKLQERYLRLKRHLLLQKQKTFVQRIDSLLDDKKAWLSSVSQSLVGKPLELITDEEEPLLYDMFKNMVHELDSLTELSYVDIDETKEQIYNLQFVSFGSVPQKNIIRVSLAQSKNINVHVERIKKELSDDIEYNKVILTTLLQKLLNNE